MNPDQQYLEYLKIADSYSKNYPFLDTAVYTLLISIADGSAVRKKTIYKIKRLLFPIYIFYKYFNLRSLSRYNHVPRFNDADILTIVHGSGPQHYGDLVKIIDSLIDNKKKIIVVIGSISQDQKRYLGSKKNLYIIEQLNAAYNIGILEFIRNILNSLKYMRGMRSSVKNDNDFIKMFDDYKGFMLDNIFICLSHYKYSQRILQNNSIKIVFSSNDFNYLARSYFIHSNKLGIENFILHHGFGGIIHSKAVAKNIVSWSILENLYFIQNGFPEERLLSLGLPRYDQVVKSNNLIENKCNHTEVIKIPKICFFYTQHSSKIYYPFSKYYIEEINEITPLLKRAGMEVFLKMHPSDNVVEYKKILDPQVFNMIDFLGNNSTISEVIKEMDVCVLPLSAAIIEVILSNIVAVYVNYDNFWDSQSSYFNTNSVYTGNEVKNKNELYKMIKRILNDSKYKEEILGKQNDFISRNIFNVGIATEKIVEYVLDGLKRCRIERNMH